MRLRLPLGLALVLIARVAMAAEPALPKNDVVLADDPSLFAMTGNGASKAGSTIVAVVGQPFAKAWRVTVKEKLVADYDAQFSTPSDPSLKKGDVILLTAYARMLDSKDESGEGRIGLVLEQAKEPYDKVFAATFGVGRAWTRFDVPAVIDRDLAPTGGHFLIRVGAYAQTLEIGGVTVRRFAAGTDLKTLPRTLVTYAGREATAPWRKAAADRIEQIRKADLTVNVVDATGKPVPDATVAVRMARQAFIFGSCYSPPRILEDSADATKYREAFLANFNAGVDEYAMKWPGWLVPVTRRKAIDALKWMDDHGIAVRGHALVWPGWNRLPPTVKTLSADPAKLQAAILDHIEDEVDALRGRVIDWDVVNEPFANHDLMDVLGDAALVDWFKAARAADPRPTLYLNETSVPTSPPNDERYAALFDRVKKLRDSGAPIGGVGMQSHFGQDVQPPTRLLAILDRFQQLGLPVRITELDIDTSDEQLQADYLRDFLTACFSHPNVNGILMWGFWEGAHWRPNAAMFRNDWSPRPIAGVWHDLVRTQWWTTVDGKTDARGTFATRGFLGNYEVAATRGAQTVRAKLTLGGTTNALTLTLPNP